MNPTHPIASRAARLAGSLLISVVAVSCATTDGVRDDAARAETETGRLDIALLHPMAQAIARVGAPECAAKVHEAAIYLIVDTESGAIVHSGSDDLYSFSLEVIDPDGMTSYVSLNIAPGEDAACAISYEIVTPVGRDCAGVAETLWPGAVPGNPLRKNTIPIALGDGQTALLHPVGDACLVIRKEIIP